MTHEEFQEKYDFAIQSMKEHLIATNAATEEQLNDDVYLSKVVQNFILDPDQEFVIDHRDTLLKEAEKFFNEGNYELSRLFYATYVEHTFNNIIDLVCIRNKYDRKTSNSIIRSVNMDSKRTWLLTLLGIEPIADKHKPVLKALTDQRNGFIHYKYHLAQQADKLAIKEEFKKIKESIEYLKEYERISLLGE